jgi:hypothetical protein
MRTACEDFEAALCGMVNEQCEHFQRNNSPELSSRSSRFWCSCDTIPPSNTAMFRSQLEVKCPLGPDQGKLKDSSFYQNGWWYQSPNSTQPGFCPVHEN